MQKKSYALVLAAALATGTISGTAWAHAKLLQSVPAASAVAAAGTQQVELRFNETLIERFAKVSLQYLGADGKAKPQEIEGVQIVFADDKKGVIAKFTQVLKAGQYKVEWRVVSADTHPIKGEFSFTVQ